MLATALCHTSCDCFCRRFLISSSKSQRPISIREFPTLKRTGFERFRGFEVKRMTEINRISALRSNGDSEDSGFLETEVVMRKSPLGFGRELVPGGLESTLNKLSKWLVTALFGAVILWKHDAEAMWAAVGSIVNVGLSIALKKILNQERPVSAVKSDPGMPSSHAQSIFFAVFFSVFSVAELLGINAITVTVGVFAFICGSYLAWLRVSQGLHTISQVLVGALLGSVFCVMWFWFWHAFVWKAFVSSILVRIVVLLGAVGCCSVFLFYVIRDWVMEEL